MLTEKAKEEDSKEQIKSPENSVIIIYDDPAMQSALDAITILGKLGEITIRASGNSIPKAVAVANIITENIMKGNSKIQKISVDSEPIQELGRSRSNIEINLKKI
ncbi:MAG: ribonuclease P subunit p25 family protein [Nitrosopumilus sp.]|nr:ribonuclease P subunit p25 family protein [Nitrosopumilus sp.]